MARLESIALVLGVTFTLSVPVALGSIPALAQENPNGAEAYGAGVKLGRALNDPRKCTGGGDYYQGCEDGVQESQFDREADQLLDSDTRGTKPPERAPLLSPPPGLFQDPYSKPGDGGPPNQ
jgi:hypothetical protein